MPERSPRVADRRARFSNGSRRRGQVAAVFSAAPDPLLCRTALANTAERMLEI